MSVLCQFQGAEGSGIYRVYHLVNLLGFSVKWIEVVLFGEIVGVGTAVYCGQVLGTSKILVGCYRFLKTASSQVINFLLGKLFCMSSFGQNLYPIKRQPDLRDWASLPLSYVVV